MRVRLREVRLSKLLTQEEVARRAGLSEATVNRLETGATEARISTVRKLAAALEVDPSALIVAGGEASG
jgi:transcriptional regulator with XRE-family HTH domain